MCEGIDAQDVSSPTATLSGADCNEGAIRAAVEQGGTIVIDCPDAPVLFTSQMVVGLDTVIDGNGVTVLDGGGTTRLLYKPPGPSLYLQNLTITRGQAPEALGDPSVTQANWFDWAGGAIVVQCHDNTVTSGGGLFAKDFTCTDSHSGSSTRDPDTDQILDTGTGGCIYSFTCAVQCDGCEFRDNGATNGGAIGTLGGKAQITGSVFIDNAARYDASSNDNQGFGGAWYQDGTETSVGETETNAVHFCGNVFQRNVADTSGGAVQLFYRQNTRTSFEFQQNLCQDNATGAGREGAPGQGGCLYVYVDPDTKIPWAPDVGPDAFVVSRNSFVGNRTDLLGGGAAIYNIWDTATRFDNNVFTGNAVESTNQDQGGGGALGLVGTYFDLEYNTFSSNTANNSTGGVKLGAGSVGLRNNLFFRNAAPYVVGQFDAEQSEHVNYQLDEVDDDQYTGFQVYASSGNLFTPSTTASGEPRRPGSAAVVDEDPLLSELVTEVFPAVVELMSGSPAIDAGVPLETVDVDILGTPRGATPDIGAFEAE